MAYTVDIGKEGGAGKVTKSETRLSKIVPGPAPQWAPHKRPDMKRDVHGPLPDVNVKKA